MSQMEGINPKIQINHRKEDKGKEMVTLKVETPQVADMPCPRDGAAIEELQFVAADPASFNYAVRTFPGGIKLSLTFRTAGFVFAKHQIARFESGCPDLPIVVLGDCTFVLRLSQSCEFPSLLK